ncbi:MAG: hypothetical protein LH618_11140, partial [Saprospiraceae bacterium]|nr:hypothetical protein [Saprospiraceae bacterium]
YQIIMVKDNYTLLIEKLDGFIRKFYINQLLRGALYTVGAILGLFIVLNLLEYYMYFGTGVRTAMFWSFLLLSGAALYRWVALPLMHYFQLGKVISHEQAATIVGQHFLDVKDKLLNILQLKQQNNNAIYAELINASINQKSEAIRLIPFQSAIDLGKNRKYLRYALPPVLLLMFLLLGAPNILREGTMRLWNARTTYERPAPFRFLINPDSLQAVQFADYLLKVKVDGQVLPNEVFVTLGNVQYRLTKDAANEFSYKFVNVQKDIPFQLFAGGVESRDYILEVLRKPSILSFNTKLNFPDYLGRASEELANVGDLVIPQGTNIGWVFNAQSTDQMSLRFSNEQTADAKRFDDELFSFNRRALRDETYQIFLSNARLPGGDSVAYTITIIPDLHPQIAVEEFRDSTQGNVSFFAGDASDDYGLLNLTFNYQIKKAKSGQLPMNTVKITKPAGKAVSYEYNWDVRDLNLEPGDEVSYYFEVFDNDGVNGSKSARTTVMQYKMPTMSEFRQQQAQNSEEIKKDLEKALKESAKIQEELKKLRNKVLQQKEMDWQSRKEMEKLLDRQKQLEQQIQQAKQNFDQNKQQQQEFKQENPDLQEKQDKLEKLFDDAMSEEMKKLVEDIQKLLQEMNKDEMLEKMEKMEMSTEETTKELDRLQELYKQLEVEQMVDQQIQELEEMAKKEDELAAQAEDENKNAEDKKSDEELKKEQEELNKQFEELQKKQQEMMEKNEELQRPQKIEDTKEEMQDTKNDMKDAKESLEQGQKKKAGKKQKSAAGKMKDMANKMKKSSQGGEMEQMEEDVKSLRQLLENLVGLSFAQEKNMKEIEGATINTPRYVELGQEQYKIKDDFKLVEDSLQALASRNFQIESMVTEKVTEIKGAIKYSIQEIEERRINTANEQQQHSMKALNDLALMLSEVMEQMQQQMASAMPGSQACQKPGKGKGKGKGEGGKAPMDKITKGQGDVNQQMKDLKKRMEEQGKKPGGKDPNGKGGGGQGEGGGDSQEFAKMAAKQAAMRNALRELQKQKQEQGKGSKALDEIMNEMNKVETDLVNKRLTNEMLQRQEQIMSRLLEEERAERERDQDEQRQAEAAKQQPAKMPPALEEYLKKRRAEVEQFRTVSPALKPFYKRMVEDYLKGGTL